MIVTMDMSTGKVIADEFGRFEDEVLNAEWLPPQPELQLGLQEAVRSSVHCMKAASCLDRFYRSQE